MICYSNVMFLEANGKMFRNLHQRISNYNEKLWLGEGIKYKVEMIPSKRCSIFNYNFWPYVSTIVALLTYYSKLLKSLTFLGRRKVLISVRVTLSFMVLLPLRHLLSFWINIACLIIIYFVPKSDWFPY